MRLPVSWRNAGIVSLTNRKSSLIDEAHRATKDHAYAEVARMIRAQNPNMRILALTATPSSEFSVSIFHQVVSLSIDHSSSRAGKPAGVQEVIDALGLSHIELLSETSRALLPYQHKKVRLPVYCSTRKPLAESLKSRRRQPRFRCR